MTKLVKVSMVEPYEPHPENHWFNIITGFDEWINKNYEYHQQIQKQRRVLTRTPKSESPKA